MRLVYVALAIVAASLQVGCACDDDGASLPGYDPASACLQGPTYNDCVGKQNVAQIALASEWPALPKAVQTECANAGSVIIGGQGIFDFVRAKACVDAAQVGNH